jgi:biopolymer transport protein ExbB
MFSRTAAGRGLLLGCLLLAPALAQAWWQADWQFRKPLTIQPPAEEASLAAADVPVLLRLHAGNFGYFTDTLPDGADLRLMGGDDQTPLKFHIERYDPATGMGLIWARVPQLASGAPASAFLYYGNAQAPAGGDAAGTYDADQALVLHFGETDGLPRDATANANHAAESSAQALPGSLIGGGLRFTGGETLRVPGSASLAADPAKGLTVSLWLKPDAATSGTVLGFGNGAEPLRLDLEEGVPVARLGAAEARASSPLSAGAWHHLAVTLDGTALTVYVDGAAVGAADSAIPPLAGDLVLGMGAPAGDAPGLAMEVDEVGVARVSRSAAYLRLLALSQGSAASLVSYGEDESGESDGGHGSYIGVVLQNVTIDGWVIIGMLAVMSAISWVVMFGKGRFLALARKRNAAFQEAFRKLGDGDLTALAKRADFIGAPLQRVCAAATDELDNRLLHRSVGAHASALSPQALDALRARVDAAAVREQQRLNAGMVLLTIAISGGPFLGLLGTVVGVMITFAAIAASGDVNVNSIAPGIAAALVATVAGLVVAIPALFGYNYLGTLIRDTTTDLRVFVDELLADIAERHSV